MMLRHLYLFIAFSCLPFLLSAQSLDQFSENRGEFLKQMESLMTASKRNVMEDIYKDFAKRFKGGTFTDEEFILIHKISNAMLKQKMKASPYFSNYLKCLISLKQSQEDGQQFSNLHEVLDNILANIQNRKLTPYKLFLAFSLDFFEKNTLRYSKNGVTWTALSDKYELKYENNEPVVMYENLNLVASRKKDSIAIIGTSGTYYPIDLRWEGRGGKVSWERFGLKDDINCELGDYVINTKKALYEVAEAELNYPEFFPGGSIKGTLIDKVVTANRATEGSYPRFESQDSVLQIDNLGEGINYVGGFRLHGTTVYGYGNKDNKARIIIKDGKNKTAFSGASELFVIRKEEKLAAERLEAILYFNQDSIYHPSVNIKFDIPNKILSLNRGKRGSDRNPFFSSLHKMNLDSDNIDWYMNRDSMVFGKNKVSITGREKAVSFESLKYFSEADYRRIQNIATFNPVAMFKRVAEEEGTNVVSANILAEKFNSRFDASSIQSLLYDLVSKGFINYDSDREIIEMKDKIFHYADANEKKVDYDILKVVSNSDSINAVFTLKDGAIRSTGVKNVGFSLAQRVALRPTEGQLTILENRNMDFDGRLFAGYGVLEGKDFFFTYDKNQVDMDSIRFFDLFVPTDAEDENGNPIALSIASRIEHTNGVLLIDAPNNKAGQEDIPIFPSFNSKGPAYVFYDYDSTQSGCYRRDSFFFELDPFNFNSLDKFTREDITFTGKMVSAEIFPDFTETLLLRDEDESLGFTTSTPAEGYPTYQGMGNYKGDIDLSNRGFLGKGSLTYLKSTFDSEDIVFKPKQLLATADRFDLEEDRSGAVEVPKAVGYDVSIDWHPYSDSMYITSKEKAFELFQAGEHTLDGMLILTPGGLKAEGEFEWDKGLLRSDMMSFGAYSVDTDTSDLQIYAFGTNDLAFDTRDVSASLDFDKQIGRIKANSDQLSTTMPYNQYQTSMNEFFWDMSEETITFKADENRYGNFRSIHPDQDSLTFQGKTAFYDLKTNELKIGGVPFIKTCDAFVYTESGDIEIQKGGVMTTLQNAKIIADTISKYHIINRATVDVLGKKEYKAKGFYEYNIGDKTQEIEFADIIGTRVGKGKRSEKKTVTRATGQVEADDNFYIDHKTEYRGKISLSAESKNLQFEGFARLDAPLMPDPQWFSVKFEGDKNDLAIVYDVPKNYKGQRLYTGLFLSKETARIYPRVMMPLFFTKDRPIFSAKGLFKYDKVRDEFNFGDSLKIVDDVMQGNRLTYANKDGKILAEGKLDIGSGLDYINVNAAGRVSASFDDKTSGGNSGQPGDANLLAELMAGIDMMIPEKLLKIMINDLRASSFDARVLDYNKDTRFYERTLSEFIPDAKSYNSTISEMKNSGLHLPSKQDKYSFFFSNLPMKWNSDYQSFVSANDKIGLNSVAGTPINRWLSCFVEFKMPSNNDDRVYVYIRSPSDFYYFYGYQQGVLSIVSNNTKFNETLLSMKKKEKMIKMKDGEFFEIQEVEPGSAQMFVNRIKATR
ncbi:MAG: hypothetical protein AAGG75_17395 [Bacteroidota bacterium]